MAQRSHSSYVGKYMFCDPNILRHDRDRPSNGTTSVVGQKPKYSPRADIFRCCPNSRHWRGSGTISGQPDRDARSR
jgi:hypothetical protein